MPARSRNSAATDGSGHAPILVRMIAAWEGARRRKADEIIRKHVNMQQANVPWQRQTAVMRSVRDRSDISQFDQCEIGRDALPPAAHAGVSAVVVAGAWLAFYVITAIHHSMASSN